MKLMHGQKGNWENLFLKIRGTLTDPRQTESIINQLNDKTRKHLTNCIGKYTCWQTKHPIK